MQKNNHIGVDFKPAKILLSGKSKSGKTLTALIIATTFKDLNKALLGKDDKIVIIDAENGAAKAYERDFGNAFDIYPIPSNKLSITTLSKALTELKNQGYTSYIIDSLSPVWSGPAGLLNLGKKRVNDDGEVNEQAFEAFTRNFGDWAKLKGMLHMFYNFLESWPFPIIFTARERKVTKNEKDAMGRSSYYEIPDALDLGDAEKFDFILDARLQLFHRAYLAKIQSPTGTYHEVVPEYSAQAFCGATPVAKYLQSGDLLKLKQGFQFIYARSRILNEGVYGDKFNRVIAGVLWAIQTQVDINPNLLELLTANNSLSSEQMKELIKGNNFKLSKLEKVFLQVIFNEYSDSTQEG